MMDHLGCMVMIERTNTILRIYTHFIFPVILNELLLHYLIAHLCQSVVLKRYNHCLLIKYIVEPCPMVFSDYVSG